MKNVFLFLLCGLAMVFAGCETLLNEPGSLLTDPQFTEYDQKMKEAESSYLKKEITYAEYLEKKKELDQDYNEEANKRKQVIENPEAGGSSATPTMP
ncbi:MAG: hypothetical protein NUV91_06080 [Candidatus Omnitrophica bacterium]|nr:hypothetical protein [Candidatus Omnitrophota bacterium]